jgi:hypothetical protein
MSVRPYLACVLARNTTLVVCVCSIACQCTLVFSNCIMLLSHGNSVDLKFLVNITKMDMFCDDFFVKCIISSLQYGA